jgi:hypothetical protein
LTTTTTTKAKVTSGARRRARAAPRVGRVDGESGATTVSPMTARMTVDEQLRNQDWEEILAKLTTFAWRHTNRRSWELAQDLASQAIADACAHVDGWDPAAEPLLKNLCRRVFGLATKEWRRKRNTFEVAMSRALKQYGASVDGGKKEIQVDSGEEPLDEMIHRRQVAEMFRTRMLAKLAGDEIALAVLEKMLHREEITPAKGKASGFDADQIRDGSAQAPPRQVVRGLEAARIRDARRRVFRHAESVSAELAEELEEEESEFLS